MKKLFLFAFLITCLTSFKNLGEPIAELKCKSVSGRTYFKAIIPDASYIESAELSIDGTKLSFGQECVSHIIFEPENKVFTMYLESKTNEPSRHKFLKFWAIPSSFKLIKSQKGDGTQFHDTYEFRAKFYATEPRKEEKSPNTKTIELSCVLDYQL
jgi:hypothetical protein